MRSPLAVANSTAEMELEEGWRAAGDLNCIAHLPCSASAGTERLFAGRADGVIETWSWPKHAVPEHDILESHAGAVTCLDVVPLTHGVSGASSPPPMMLVSGSVDSMLRVWRLDGSSSGGGSSRRGRAGDARDGSGVAASRRAGSGGIAGAHDRGGGSAVHRIIDEQIH